MTGAMLDTAPAGAARLDARAIDGQLLYTTSHVWGWWRLPLTHLDYLTPAEQEQEAHAAAMAWSGMAGHELHVLTMAVPADPDGWARRAADEAHAPRGDWQRWAAAATAHLRSRDDLQKAVYVGVRLGERRPPLLGRRLGAMFGRLERAAGVDDHMVPEAELARWRRSAQKIGRPLTDGALAASPARASEIALLVAHAVRRGHPRGSLPPSQRWGAGQLVPLIDGELHRARTHVRAVGPDGHNSFHTVLTVARMPERMIWPPGPPWLCLHEWLQEHIEVSGRWRVVDHRTAGRDVRSRIAAARDQTRHTTEAGGHLPQRDLDRLDTATGLEARLDRDRTALVYAHTRLIISAESPELLDEIADEVTEQYRHVDIELARPSWDQLALLIEAIPGDRVHVNAYRQVHEPEVLGGAMPTASAALGDGRGPYLGFTTGRLAEQPVHYSPWEAVNRRDQQRETTIAVTGSLGGGKTVTLMAIAAAAWRSGARVVAFDPKGDLARLAALPGADVDVIDLTDAPDGVLDPWSLIEDPDAAKMVALEAIDRLVAGRAESHHRAVIDQAVEAEAHSTSPSLSGVVDRLSAGNPAAREIASTLNMYRTMPLARLAFRPSSGGITLGDGITIITTPGVEYPPAGTPLREMSWPQRLAVAATYLVGTYARRAALHADPDRPKLIALDEAWALTSTDQGRALIAETSRMGRSRRAALLLASQSAVDLSDDVVRNCISTVIAHRIGSDSEGDAVAQLLGVTPSSALTSDLYDLRAGEAVMRDLDRRVGRVQVDVSWDLTVARLLDHNVTAHQEAAG
ncbi:VirB4 family type IV secretion system protein [Nitriliruptor alkaliphilus]|uniref:VirB4 family type IV secretion system protein n=1 Tax=Nitriliruptor alkaliphilus TaxID=427918 RepID=UPI000698AA8B|nr:ATP-binding protein [Nitriliruptor alkaliphilus]